MRKIILVGLDHSLQWKDTEAGDLRSLLSDLLKGDPAIDLIAEETAPYPTTVGMRVAFQFNKPWANIDLDKMEKQQRGIPDPIPRRSAPLDDHSNGTKQFYSEKYDPIREDVWLLKIDKFQVSRVLFVCGLIHLDTFASRLTARDWDVTPINVCCEQWYVERFGTKKIFADHGERWCEERPDCKALAP
jgi:hypothetical protein